MARLRPRDPFTAGGLPGAHRASGGHPATADARSLAARGGAR